MNTLIHADVFFFISSIGFIVLCGLLIVALIYVVGILKSVKHISRKLEDDVDDLSAEAKEFFGDIRQSMVYRMIFGKGRTAKKVLPK